MRRAIAAAATSTGRTTTTITTAAEPRAARPTRLAWWLSPAFPVGGYAYSHALEWAAEAGDLPDEAACSAWIGDVVCRGAGRSDAILLKHASEAILSADRDALAVVNDLALALSPSSELRLETTQQGRSFLDAVLAAWPDPVLGGATADLDAIAYPIAVGAAAAAHCIPAADAVPIFLGAFAHNLVSAAMRLAPIGQLASLRILAALEPGIAATVAEVTTATLDDIGSATVRADLGSFRHETQYTRLFRS